MAIAAPVRPPINAWLLLDGMPRFHASREEQFIVGARVLAGQGISAWNPSRSCWGGKVGSAKKVVPVETPAVKKVTTPAPKVVKKKKEAPKVVKKSVAATSAPKTIKKQTPPPTAHVAKKAAASYLIHRGDSLSKIAAAQHERSSQLGRIRTCNVT